MSDLLNLPAAENLVIRVRGDDNVAVARVPISEGQEIRTGGVVIHARSAVPVGHKVALEDIEAGAPVIRYGLIIGRARRPIRAGEHVHEHNLALETGSGTYDFPAEELHEVPPPESGPSFLGYPRPDGRAGTRNYVAVVAASNCAAFAAELAASRFPRESLPENVHGVAAFPHGYGCGTPVGPDLEQLRRTIGGILHHPNVAGVVVLGLGCEVNQIEAYLDGGDDRILGLTLQDAGGTRAAAEKAAEAIRGMMERAAATKRREEPAWKLVLGLQCGGSDAFSGITANPALGACCDRLVAAGGAIVLAETPETFGAENLLVRRARNRRVAEAYLAMVERYKAYLRPYGSTFEDNPSPGNKEGGLTNIVEKSLGAVAKAGTSPLMAAYEYAERITARGFVFMNTPGYDPVSLTGIAAGGANIIAFTTGRGSATGFPIVPVIKIASNSATYRRMREDMDVNAGAIADGEAAVEEIGREIFDLVLRVASGETTCSERLGHNEFVPWRIGPVL